jgi:hypothetical protein
MEDEKVSDLLAGFFNDVHYGDISGELKKAAAKFDCWTAEQYRRPVVTEPRCEEEEQLRLLASTKIGGEAKEEWATPLTYSAVARAAANLMIQSPSIPGAVLVDPVTFKDLKDDLDGE